MFYQDHVRTARAKGLRERVVIFRHVFRSALIPVLTVVGLQLGGILGGAVVAEQIFAIPGIGLLTLEALLARDYPIILMTVMIFAGMFMVITLPRGHSLHGRRSEDQVLAMTHATESAPAALREQEYLMPPRQRFNPLRWARREPAGALGVVLILIVAFGAGAAPLLGTTDPQSLDAFTANILERPSADAFFGTDRQGRDVWSRVLYGGRISLKIGMATVIVGDARRHAAGPHRGLPRGRGRLHVQPHRRHDHRRFPRCCWRS